MLGAIAGDMIGSVFEWNNVKSTKFPLWSPASDFTDDSVLTFAVADALMSGKDYSATIRQYANAYPDRGYGGRFRQWIRSGDTLPYNSFGNGSAMRVSPVGFAFKTEAEVLREATRTAEVTHNHPEGIKGAQATAYAIFLASQKTDKESIRKLLSEKFSYDLGRTLDDIRPNYRFDVTCQGSVPEAIIAFLESNDFEDCIRKAISLGGDSDTIACIAGGIAQAHYGVPPAIAQEVRTRLPPELRQVLDAFHHKFTP